MELQGCSISEAVRKSGVEAYVLRYWEEEGLLNVKRNRKGHRCYTQTEFDAIKEIQKLKEEGYTLKDIRKIREGHRENTEATAEQYRENKEHNGYQTEDIPRTDAECEKVQSEDSRKAQFYAILERVVKEVAVTRNREARYRRLDEAIRKQQSARRMLAATTEKEKKEKHKNKR